MNRELALKIALAVVGMAKVLDKARSTGSFPQLPDQELLRDMLAGAVIHRLLMQTNQRSLASAPAVRRATGKRLIGSVSSEKGHATVVMTSGISEPVETLLTMPFSVWPAF